MASPRKRYAIIECSLLREEWSDAAKLACVQLLLLMAERSAADLLTPEQSNHIRLSPADVAAVSGNGGLDSIREFAADTRIKMTTLNSGWVAIHWPKVAKTQGWGAPGRGRRRAISGASRPDLDPKSARPSGLRPPASASASGLRPPEDPEEESEGADAPHDLSKLVNLIAKEPGGREDKMAWLKDELQNMELLIDVDVASGKVGDTKAARMAALKSRILRHYKQKVRRIDSDKGKTERRLYTIDETREAALRREKEAAAAQESMTCEDCGAPALKRKARRWLCDECYEAA